MASPTLSSLTSFSGADLIATFADQAIAELQQITWAIQREKAPIYTLGCPDPRSFSRNKRAIAGSLNFFSFDHYALEEAMKRNWDKIAPPAMFTAAGNIATGMTEDFGDALDTVKWNKKVTDDMHATYSNNGFGFAGSSELIPNDNIPGSNGKPILSPDGYFVEGFNDSEDSIIVPPGFEPIRGNNILYADTLPPFDVTLTFANEYGHTAFQKLYDLEILNESSGASVDSNVMERQMTYVARRISPLTRGIYTRDDGGNLRGVQPYTKK